MKKRKETNRTKSFDQIMELCHRRIRNIASYGGMNCFYEIPGMLVGFPLYNLEECIHYVIDKLRNTGFLVQLLPPPHIGVVYISWDPQEIKPKRPALMAPADKAKKKNPPLLIDTDRTQKGQRAQTAPVALTNPLKDRFRIF